jgi:neutral trehalase
VLFNALLCQADKDLAQIARALGEDGASFEERAEKAARAMNEKLWDEEHWIYLDFDLAAVQLIYVYAAPVPSYDRYGFAFFPTPYWRGPVWISINWFLMRGLERYGYEEQAERLYKTIVSLCHDEDFYEYFDPLTGTRIRFVLVDGGSAPGRDERRSVSSGAGWSEQNQLFPSNVAAIGGSS